MNAHSTLAPIAHISDPVQYWNDLIRRFEENEAIEDDGTDDAIDRAGVLIQELMDMPAPNAAAVRWKLDYIFSDGEESTASFRKDFLHQMFADYRRFLGDEPDAATEPMVHKKPYVRSPFRQAYWVYRYAKAAWDAEVFLPERDGADVPDEINNPLMNAHSEATIALMVAPVKSLVELQEKLEIYRAEGLPQWGEGNKLTDALIADVERLATEARNV
jgi:hypothetical protein